MIRQSSDHRRRARQPSVTANQSRHSQRSMLSAEIIDRARQVHGPIQALATASYRTCPTTQRRDMPAKSAVEAFNERRVEHSLSIDLVAQKIDHLRTALHDPSFNAFELASDMSFENLHDVDVRPFDQLGTPQFARVERLTEDLLDLRRVTLKSISNEQQTAPQSAARAFDALDQLSDQVRIARWSDYSAQPQAGPDFDCHRHPADYVAQHFDANLIHLDFAQWARLLDQMLVNGLTMKTATCLPIYYRTLIDFECEDDSLNGTPTRQQLEHKHDNLGRRPQPIERSPLALAERFPANLATIAAFFLVVHGDIAFANLPSGRAGFIRAEYFSRVHPMLLMSLFCNTRITAGLIFLSKTIQAHLSEVSPVIENSVLTAKKKIFMEDGYMQESSATSPVEFDKRTRPAE